MKKEIRATFSTVEQKFYDEAIKIICASERSQSDIIKMALIRLIPQYKNNDGSLKSKEEIKRITEATIEYMKDADDLRESWGSNPKFKPYLHFLDHKLNPTGGIKNG